MTLPQVVAFRLLRSCFLLSTTAPTGDLCIRVGRLAAGVALVKPLHSARPGGNGAWPSGRSREAAEEWKGVAGRASGAPIRVLTDQIQSFTAVALPLTTFPGLPARQPSTLHTFSALQEQQQLYWPAAYRRGPCKIQHGRLG